MVYLSPSRVAFAPPHLQILKKVNKNMFGQLKDKLVSLMDGDKAMEALQQQFARLEQMPGSGRHMAERVARFILTGEGKGVVADVSSMTGASCILQMGANYYGGTIGTSSDALPSLVKLLPQDHLPYLRLARIYESACNPGNGLSTNILGVPIPAFPDSIQWLSLFLMEFSRTGTVQEPFLPVKIVQDMLITSNEDPLLLVRGAFFCEDTKGKSQLSRWFPRPYSYFKCLQGYREFVLNSVEAVRPAFSQKDAGCRACALQALVSLNIPIDPFITEIAALAVSGSKEVRESAEQIIKSDFEKFREPLEFHAAKGNSTERYQAVRLLAQLGRESERDFFTERLRSEKLETVAEALRNALGDLSATASAEVEDFNLKAVPEVPLEAPLSKTVLADLRTLFDEFNRKTAQQFAQNKFTPLSPDIADKFFEALQKSSAEDIAKAELLKESYRVGGSYTTLLRFTAHPEFEPIHLIRWCLLLIDQPLYYRTRESLYWAIGYSWREPFMSYQQARRRPIDLRELAAALRTLGLDDRMIGNSLIAENRYFPTPFQRSDPEAIWPYFAERLDILEEALGLKQPSAENASPWADYLDQQKRSNAFKILKLFPRLPSVFLPTMWEIALGKAWTERVVAQACLEKLPNKEEKILAALASRQQDARLAAAQWLADLRYKDAIPALRKALSKEKSDFVKDEIIKALETLGMKLEEVLDLDQLDRDAENGLKKGIPKDLEWFPFSQLPPVRWADSGEPVKESMLRWFIVQGHRLNNAEANPTLRRYCSLFHKDDRERLGRFVLETWIAQDTKPKYTADQAGAEAQREAQQTALIAKQYPQYYPDFDQQRAYTAAFNRLVTEPESSQTATKGILAVAGACCGGDAAATVHRYVKQWYGYRGAQSKALLQVLAWIEDARATQVVLSVANRFRTKGIQKEAMRQCEQLAVRKGWSLDQLADRTIPTCGMDDNGTLELDYGSRTFTASLSEDMAIVVVNQNGKTVASLPDGNQSDDTEKVQQAKSALSTARKELKSILTMQKDRLYEALCTQREWSFEDWDAYLHKHPIVGRYCQRLVWTAYNDEKIVESFRPLADGTLTNRDDEEVSFEPQIVIRLAHDVTLSQEDGTAWLEHFSDYKVEPLFQQFGKPAFVLSEEMKETCEITEFLGYVLKAFSLRNKLTKLGYTRGAAQDRGWFYDYRKTFLRMGIDAVIEFTGNPLPETNRTVALQRLFFVPRQVDGGPSFSAQLPLRELPAVLLSECWNDIRMAANEGSGFAEDWEKQTEYV